MNEFKEDKKFKVRMDNQQLFESEKETYLENLSTIRNLEEKITELNNNLQTTHDEYFKVIEFYTSALRKNPNDFERIYVDELNMLKKTGK